MSETKNKNKTMTPEEIAAEAAERERKHQEELEEYYNEKVPVFIPKPEGEEAESITVTHNGRNTQIMYDEEVMVSRRIALIIEESKKTKKYADAEAERLHKPRQLASEE